MDEKKKKVFISGPMSGIKDYNKPAFDQAEEFLTKAGYSVFNPARMHFDDSWSHEEIMRIDLAALAQCDYILMLDKWYYSKGATRERNYAITIGVELLSMSDIVNKKEQKPSTRIEIESFGNISGHDLEFLQWFEKHCNEILASGGPLPSGKSCCTCKHEKDSSLGNCLNCGPYENWEPKPTSDAPKKSCKACKYSRYTMNEEPCKSCPPVHSNWKPKDAEK